MKIKTWSAQGFGTFVEPQMLVVGDMRPGLYHVTGINEVEPRLQANAVGKSTFFESLYWTLYGHTSRRLHGNVLKNWNADVPCIGRVWFDDMEVWRKQGPNELRLLVGDGSDWKDCAQDSLDPIIGLSAEAFLHSIFFPQFVDAFVDLTPAARMDMYSSVMKLDFWEEASDNASRTSKTLVEKIQTAIEKLERMGGELTALEQTSYEAEIREWESRHAARTHELGVTIAGNEKRQDEIERQLKALPSNGERDKILETLGSLGSKITNNEAEGKKVQYQLAQMAQKQPATCPTCGAPWTKRHMETEGRNLDTRIRSLSRELDVLYEQQRGLMTKAEALNKDYKHRAELERLLAETLARIRTSEVDLKRQETEVNPYLKKQDGVKKRVAELRADLESSRGLLDEDRKLADSVQYWVPGYKQIRLGLIEESLHHLNVEVNESLFQLGLEQWQLRFDVEKETKRGTIKHGFQCMVKAPHSEDSVPWEVWSGGESQRLRLAASLGVSNLILSRTGIACNVELWDEPSTWLSEMGIQDMLEVLTQRAERLEKVILLADHRALEFGGFAGTIMIRKTKQGSTIHVS